MTGKFHVAGAGGVLSRAGVQLPNKAAPARWPSASAWAVAWLTASCLISSTCGNHAASLVETFDTNPAARGWRMAGDPSLFAWSASKSGWDITWDSSRSNSFCYLPLNTVLTKSDRFQMSFVLRMSDSRAGTNPAKPAEFPITIGLLNRSLLTNINAYRGAGVSSVYGVRNVLEWNFFPDAGFGDTWATTVISSNNVFAYAHNFPVPLINGDSYQITVDYDPEMLLVRTSALRNGQPLDELGIVSVNSTPDFRLDTFSVTSYSDAIQTGSPAYYGSVLAHGTIEEVTLLLPDPPARSLFIDRRASDGLVDVSFFAQSNWLHLLERSLDLATWQAASVPVPGADARIEIRDTNASISGAFYRIQSTRP